MENLRWPEEHGGGYSERIPKEVWEYYQNELIDLHKTHTVVEIMAIMSRRYRFSASRRQYDVQFRKWGLTKYKKGSHTNDLPTSMPEETTERRSLVSNDHDNASESTLETESLPVTPGMMPLSTPLLTGNVYKPLPPDIVLPPAAISTLDLNESLPPYPPVERIEGSQNLIPAFQEAADRSAGPKHDGSAKRSLVESTSLAENKKPRLKFHGGVNEVQLQYINSPSYHEWPGVSDPTKPSFFDRLFSVRKDSSARPSSPRPSMAQLHDPERSNFDSTNPVATMTEPFAASTTDDSDGRMAKIPRNPIAKIEVSTAEILHEIMTNIPFNPVAERTVPFDVSTTEILHEIITNFPLNPIAEMTDTSSLPESESLTIPLNPSDTIQTDISPADETNESTASIHSRRSVSSGIKRWATLMLPSQISLSSTRSLNLNLSRSIRWSIASRESVKTLPSTMFQRHGEALDDSVSILSENFSSTLNLVDPYKPDDEMTDTDTLSLQPPDMINVPGTDDAPQDTDISPNRPRRNAMDGSSDYFRRRLPT